MVFCVFFQTEGVDIFLIPHQKKKKKCFVYLWEVHLQGAPSKYP